MLLLATISPAAKPRQLYAMDLSFCVVTSGIPLPQYNCRPPPSRQLELQLHGDFHKLTEAAPLNWLDQGRASELTCGVLDGARFRPGPSTTMRFHRSDLKSSHIIPTSPF